LKIVPVAVFRQAVEEARAQLRLLQRHEPSSRMLGVAVICCAPAGSALEGQISQARAEELGAVAERLAGCVRKQDAMFCLEHGYFAILYRGVASPAHLKLAAMQLERTLTEPLYSVDDRVNRRLHAAISGYTADQTVAPLLKRLMEGVRRARRDGAVLVTAELAAAEPDQEDNLLEALEQALVEGELVPYFQPKVHSRFRSLVGAEALIRWQSPQRGLVPPDRFVPLIEQSELVAPFTYQLFRQVLSAMQQWPRQVSVAVNVPGTLITAPHLPDAIADALGLFSMPPSQLSIEVTEASFVGDLAATRGALDRIRAMGVRVSIDDFGTGYSSLAYLRDLPVDEVKLDRSFIRHLDVQEKDQLLVGSVIELAHRMGLKVVGEGVETEAVAETLTRLGCDVLQGFLFGKPVPSDDFAQWMQRMPASRRAGRG
jgi:EAL domain-containing protein (putative c-di-GMP-specific phosphodiesterase class I)